MQILPVINCSDESCVRAKLAAAEAFLEPGSWVHVDVTDGDFSKHVTVRNPDVWRALHPAFTLEVHLMVRRPEDHVVAWLAAGAKRFVVHAETLSRERAEALAATCRAHCAEIMLSFDPETEPESARGLFDLCLSFQVLAVHPGPADQTFMPDALRKIAWLRKEFPHGIIEVDGGMSPDVARAVKEAGATAVTSDHYIWNSEDPKAAYETLTAI